MIDPAFPFASWLLWLLGASFALIFGLPLLLAPVAWARAFKWDIPSDTRLVVYLGRCLGGVAVAIIVGCFRAAPDPSHHVWLFDLIAVAGGLLALVHIAGAIQKIQPWTENAEIILYVGATALAVAARTSLV